MSLNVLITGAGSGIGRALALEASSKGHHVFLVGRRAAPLEETKALAGPNRTEIIVADITKKEGRAAILNALPEKLDMLINNAGTLAVGAVEDLTDEEIDAVLSTNIAANFSLTRDCLPALKNARGQIVNIGSVFGDIAYPYFSAYSASKFAVRGFSDALRRELAKDGVRVTYVAPRATQTGATSHFDALIEPMKMKLDAPADIAAHAWRGIVKGKREVFPKSQERIFVRLQRLLPSLVDGSLKKEAAKPDVLAAVQQIRKEK